MKKILVILLALLMLVSITACGGKTEEGSKPADSGKADAGKADAGKADSGKSVPADLGHYDPNFDYSQYPTKKVAYLGMTAGELWDAYDICYENYCKKMNIEYTHLWAPTQYSAEEFLSGLQTYIDQGYDGFFLEASQNYPRVAEILDEAGIAWASGIGVARDANNNLLRPTFGFDDNAAGKQLVDKLVEWKNETYPDVDMKNVGLMLLDFGWNVEIHNRILGAEERWAELFPEFGAFNPAPDQNPSNVVIGDIATATNPDQTAAQNLATQFMSNPGDVQVWLVVAPADLYAVGAANAAEMLGVTDKSCVACFGGSAMPSRFDAGIDDAWRFSFFTPQALTCELQTASLWAYMQGLATPDDMYQEWVKNSDKGGEGHSIAQVLMPLQFIDKDNYKEYLEWCDLYAYGEGEDGDWAYEPVTDLNLYSASAEIPEGYNDR